MKSIYSSPARVYLCLGLLAVLGVLSGLGLPVSLFPNSTKPEVTVEIGYGALTAEEFLSTYGKDLEEQLRGIAAQGAQAEEIKSVYRPNEVRYEVDFKWGVSAAAALRESKNVVQAFSSRMPTEMRDSVRVWTHNKSGGFFALSFYSEKRSLDELNNLIEPLLSSKIARVQDADQPVLFNPNEKEIRLEIVPEKMATYHLFPNDIQKALIAAVSSYFGGSLNSGNQRFSVELPKSAGGIEELSRTLIPTPEGKWIHLSDVARLDYGVKTNVEEIFRTNGSESLLLYSRPKADGNVKKMSEDLLAAVKEVAPSFPPDVQYRVLVDPSEFIRASVENVLHEVAIGAGLAVVILFIFIGSLKNTATAAIEIPLSMVLAFILMKFSGMNLNLISLGGLALSAGMNVDASVVVMENIFRHFEGKRGRMTFAEQLETVIEAVKEVRFSVIASTIASLVVFLPLAFTSDLTYAILGDLAKTVVFSHGCSAIVALILVPTVRLHLLSRERKLGKEPKPFHSPCERFLVGLESWYGRMLFRYLQSRKTQWISAIVLVGVITTLGVLILPKLPREIIGKPDTDWVMLGVEPKDNTMIRQMVSRSEEVESEVMDLLGEDLNYLFTQVQGPRDAVIMARLKDKRNMQKVWKKLEARYVNQPNETYWVSPWNPSELPIPDPEDLEVSFRGGTRAERREAAFAFHIYIKESDFLPRVWTEPKTAREERLVIRPEPAGSTRWSPSEIADLMRVATQGRKVTTVSIQDKSTDVVMRYPLDYVQDLEGIRAFPVGLGDKLVPLKAIAEIGYEEVPPFVRRVNTKEETTVLGRVDRSAGVSGQLKSGQAQTWLDQWKKTLKPGELPSSVSIQVEDSQKELNEALKQLSVAVLLSIILIFVTMVIQFGDLVSAALVLAAIPLGMIGVVISLFVFKSTLSLNSVLGVILLNGIAVANSILLVDFLKRGVERGLSPIDAAVEAGKMRLRPILITSLTTILGMIPIAIGFGEGGRILQPLGITVSGGLWVSMLLTLFVVPALQVGYLNRKKVSVEDDASLEKEIEQESAQELEGFVESRKEINASPEKTATAAASQKVDLPTNLDTDWSIGSINETAVALTRDFHPAEENTESVEIETERERAPDLDSSPRRQKKNKKSTQVQVPAEKRSASRTPVQLSFQASSEPRVDS